MVDDVSEKSATEIWKQLTNTYILRSGLYKSFADSAFKALKFDPNSGQSIAEFLKSLRVKRREAMDCGNRYDDGHFRAIIIKSFPGKEFDALFYNLEGVVSAELLHKIELYHARVEARLATAETRLELIDYPGPSGEVHSTRV